LIILLFLFQTTLSIAVDEIKLNALKPLCLKYLLVL